MADENQDNNESEKQSERFSRNRGRGSGSKNRDAHFKHNDRRNYGSSDYRGSNYHWRHFGKSHRNDFRDGHYGREPYKRGLSHQQGDKKRKRFEVGNRLKEPDIGVTEFLGDHTGFFGLIKERYSDFHVNEISLDGEIAKLTNQIIPDNFEEVENVEEMKKNVPDNILEQLDKLKDEDSSLSSIEIDVTNIDKTGRTYIHHTAGLLTNIISKTIDQDGKKIMVIMKNNKKNASRFSPDDRVKWKKGSDFCYFTLHKVNMGTMEVLNRMSKILRINPNSFSYAGTKDCRAYTTQWVCLKKVHPNNILRACKTIHGAYVGNFKFESKPLKLGMLYGNRFRIAIRDVTAPDEDIEKAMVSLRQLGFINYYGLQRFGTVVSIPTHEIGKALLQGKWREAVDLILKPRDGEKDEDLAEARKIYETTKDAGEAFKRIKRSDRIEAKLLKGLQVCKETNLQGALNMIPRNTRLMYIHAYQSFVWNHIVSRRIKEFGLRPVVGDLVYENETVRETDGKTDKEDVQESTKDTKEDTEDMKEDTKEMKEDTEDMKEDTEDTKEDTEDLKEDATAMKVEDGEGDQNEEEEGSDQTNCIDVDIKKVTNATESNFQIDDKTDENNTAEDREDQEVEDDNDEIPIKILKEEDLPNYTINDIVMSQPGWKVTYPPYAKPWFDEFLAKDELTTDLRQKNKQYSLGGAYRKILQTPIDLSWKIMHYKERHDNLIMSDLDEMRNVPPPKDDPEGERKALIIEMSLKSSTYATMALREILRFDTSPQAQAAQSAAHDALLESNKVDAVKEEPSNSNDEVAQPVEVDMKSEKCDNIDEKMNVSPLPEQPIKTEDCVT